jgi:hypothetical protein
MLVNFPGCAKHRTLLTKPYDVIDGQGKTTFAGTRLPPPACTFTSVSYFFLGGGLRRAGCPGQGCEVNTRFANYVCAGCKGKDFSWYHVVLTDKEGDYLLKAWQGRGLGFSTNSKLAHRYPHLYNTRIL